MSRDGGFAVVPVVAPALPRPAEAARAFAEVKGEIDALAREAVRPITVDVPFAVTIALGAVPRLEALRPDVLAELPKHPIASLDLLATYARAAYYANLLTLPAPGEEGERDALVGEASALLRTLHVAAEALTARGLVDSTSIAATRSEGDGDDLAGDLVGLAALFTEAWSTIEHTTSITVDTVQRAATLGAMLLAEGNREVIPRAPAPNAGELRARSLGLLVRAYGECRRAVSYLRWHDGDAERIAPSLEARAGRVPRPSQAPTPVNGLRVRMR